MSTDPASTPLDLASLEKDLAQSFQPAWTKEKDSAERLARLAERGGKEDRPSRSGSFSGPRSSSPRGPRSDSRPSSGGGPRSGPGGRPGSRPGGGSRSGHPSRGHDQRPDRSAPRPAPLPYVSGWKATLVPEARGLEAVAKQIKVSAQTYPLFDLAGLILDKPERYRVKFERQGPTSSPLVQCLADETLWLNEKEAVAHVLKQQLEHFYQCERVTVEPPKGAYPVVAQCGVSGVLLGPPNYHDYQAKLRQLYTQKFAHLPFDVYKSRIQMVRDEAAVQKWKDEQSSKDEFQPRHLPEGAEPVKLGSLAEVEAHFRQNHAATAFATVGDSVSVAGPAATHGSTPAVVRLVQRTGEELRRHLLPLAQAVGQDLSSRGLQIFKAHENITYVSIARPRHLDRTSTPVSTLVLQMLEYLEAHRSIPRADQWKGLVTLRPLAEGSTETEREAAVLADLKWLLQEGHVVDYARRGLEVVRGPKPKPEAKKVVKEEEATNQTSPGAEQTQVPETKTVVIATKAEKPEVQPALAVEPEAPAVLTKSSAPDSTTPSV